MPDFRDLAGAVHARLLVGALVVSAGSAAGAPSVLIDWMDTSEGLPATTVDALARDRYGYVWIGTRSGLVRHQGEDLAVLRPDPDDPQSLPGSNVLALEAAADGALWAAISGQGLVRLRHAEVEAHWPNQPDGPLQGRFIWALAEACDGAVWGAYATDGLVRIDPADDGTRHLTPERAGIPPGGFAIELLVDSRCRLWLLRTDGLWRWRAADSKFVRWLGTDEATLPMFLSMALDSGDRAWIGGRQGLIEVALDQPKGARVIRSWSLERRVVSAIQPTADGRLWLGFHRGAALFEPDTGQRTPVGGRGDQLNALQVVDLLAGDGGELWIATVGGVARLPSGWQGFQMLETTSARGDNAVTAMAEHDGRLWIGMGDGEVFRVDAEANYAQPPEARFWLKPNGVFGLAVVGDRVWAMQRSAVFSFDRSAPRFVPERHSVDGLHPFAFIAPASRGRAWLADDSGRLELIDGAGEPLSVWHADADGPHRLDEPAPRMIRRGPDGRWWLLGASALYRQDEAGRFVAVLEAETDGFSAFAIDNGDVWVASDVLLQRFGIDADGLRQTARFTAGDGLPAGRVRGLLPRGDQLWIVTSVGLARLDIAAGRFRLYSPDRALKPMEFEPAPPAVLSDGRFAIATGGGVLLVDPDRVPAAAPPPPIYITSVRAGERHVLLPPDDDGRLSLGWRENSLELSYRALSYGNPAHTRYRVRLRGWDDAWQTFTGRTRSYYGNLPSGRYTFEVQAAGVDGAWNPAGDGLVLTVAPPPWRSAPAWAAYALAFTGLSGLGWRTLTARRRRSENLQRVEERRRLADRQRQVLTRLNRSLEAGPLAGAIGESVLEMTGASACHVAFLHADFPQHVWSFGDATEPTVRDVFDAALAGRAPGKVLRLAESAPALAAVWLPEPGAAERADDPRLSLFVSACEQVLENARLLVEVRQLAVKARAASDAKSEFLAAMSHEIRTPLHGLLGMMEVLEHGERNPDRIRTVRTMRDSGRQLQRMLNDVLDLSRIESGRLDLADRLFELPLLLERVIDLHAPNAAAAGLALRLRADADLPVLAQGDPDRLAQVLGNLLSNAIKFTAEGAVELAAGTTRGGVLMLSVTDTGPGIAPARQDELFEPFTQLESAATRRHGGTGLGLAICRRLIGAMGGTLALDSRPGHGSRFSIRLPRPAAPPRPRHRTALLDAQVVGCALPAPDARILLRICRRWGLGFVRVAGDRTAPPDVLVYRDDRIGAAARAGLRTRGVRCVHLGASERGAVCLPEPLTEARLIGALLDLRMRPPAAG